MPDCPICQQIDKHKNVIYEDDKVFAALNPTGLTAGHIILMPRNHCRIVEEIPDYVMGSMFTIANTLSKILFEALSIKGTNLLWQNGPPAGQIEPHTMLHIIPRSPEDGVSFQWRALQLNEEIFSTVELKLKEQAKNIGIFQEEPPKTIDVEPVQTTAAKMSDTKEKTNDKTTPKVDYKVKHLRRIP